MQWIRTCLPMQGTRVQSLVQEDSTCLGATKPANYNYRACKLQLLRPGCLESVLHKRSHCNEKPVHHIKEQLPLATTRGSLSTATKTQCNQNKEIKCNVCCFQLGSLEMEFELKIGRLKVLFFLIKMALSNHGLYTVKFTCLKHMFQRYFW